jgi:hypothetical protein
MEWSNPLAEAQWALPQRNGICSIFAGRVRGGSHKGDRALGAWWVDKCSRMPDLSSLNFLGSLLALGSPSSIFVGLAVLCSGLAPWA